MLPAKPDADRVALNGAMSGMLAPSAARQKSPFISISQSVRQKRRRGGDAVRDDRTDIQVGSI
jgi:hypothetical protein